MTTKVRIKEESPMKNPDFRLYSVILQKGYTPLKSRELEELPRFRVMSWQPFQLPWSASLCLFK